MKRLILFCLFLCAAAWSQTSVTPPAEFLGFTPGDEAKLADYETIIAYLKLLDRQSNRMQLEELGKTTEGRPFYLVLISHPQNLQNRLQILNTQARLADPRSLRAGEEKKWIRQTPVIVSINCSIHPREIGPSQMAMELAYRLASGQSAELLEVLRRVVLLLIPSHNPDGLDAMVQEYQDQQRNKETAATLKRPDHPYAGHDLNRDWFMLSQKETRLTVERVYNLWRPHIVFDLHQMGDMGARMFLPPYIDPQDPYTDPILQAEVSALGMAMAVDMTAMGLAGVAHNLYFDPFSPARNYSLYHAGIRILGEIASANMATPVQVKAADLHVDKEYDPEKRSWRQPLVWKPGEWRLADIVRYGLEASLSLLRHAAADRESYLSNAFQVLQKAVSERSTFDYYVIPAAQHDPYSVYEMLSLLRTGLIEIYRSTAPVVNQNRVLAAPVYVIPLQQPYRSYLRTLMEETHYEELTSSFFRPYDVTTHHLPSLMGVQVFRYAGRLENLELVDQLAKPEMTELGADGAGGCLIDYRSNQAVKAVTRLFQQSAPVYWLQDSIRTSAGFTLPPGTLYVEQDCRSLFRDLAVQIYHPAEPVTASAWRVRSPRIGLFRGPLPDLDEGWTRFILQEYGFVFSPLTVDNIRGGHLRDRYDLLLFPDQSPNRLLSLLITPDRSSDDEEGLPDLRRFVELGGTLLLINRSCELAVSQWALGIRNQIKGLKSDEYFVPGSLLRMMVDTNQPLGYGLPRDLLGFVQHSPAFQVLPPWSEAIVYYPGENLLKSGLLIGENQLALQTAVASATLGQGRIILVGLRPQFRAQTHATYKLLFNGIFLSNATPVDRPE